jgi:hypothetical protein
VIQQRAWRPGKGAPHSELATRLIIEEGLEGEAGDAVGRDYYEHGAQAGQGYRNGYRASRCVVKAGSIREADVISSPRLVTPFKPRRHASTDACMTFNDLGK